MSSGLNTTISTEESSPFYLLEQHGLSLKDLEQYGSDNREINEKVEKIRNTLPDDLKLIVDKYFTPASIHPEIKNQENPGESYFMGETIITLNKTDMDTHHHGSIYPFIGKDHLDDLLK
jgi:L-rhamnose isomerase